MTLEGQYLGEFEILELLGQGGMGAVYKARQTSLGRTVALKTLQAALAGDPEYILRFQQEARAAAVLNHPNLVQVYSAGESDGFHWFAMEYVEGESARARLKRKGRLDPREAIAIAIHVATALEYGWRKAALIHRDIKPDNIFLSDDGEVKLGDLGLAKSAGQNAGLTVTGASMGTPHYISPEQVEAMSDVDLRADIYSLGCTLYHLLCGQPPFDGNSAVSIMMKHVTAAVPELPQAWPECPQMLAAVVAKMMQKRPADRPQTYADVIDHLRRAYHEITNPPVAKNDAPSPSGPEAKRLARGNTGRVSLPQASPIVRSKALLYAGAGLGALLLVAAAVFFLKVNRGVLPGRATIAPNAASDPIPPGSVWRDDHTTFSILQREGDTFRGRVEIGNWIRQVTGEVRGHEIYWLARNVQANNGNVGDDNTGVIEGGRIEFKWHGPHGAGAYTLVRVPEHAAVPADLGRPRAVGWDTGPISSPAAQPPPSVAAGVLPQVTKAAPFENSLGMKFVPVIVPRQPGVSDSIESRVLFSVWDTRVQDYAAYAAANPKVDGSWKSQNKEGVPAGRGLDHPVVGVDWDGAQAFCRWLTDKEINQGKLPHGSLYRLPTDEEWSWAVGLPREPGTTPAEKSTKNSTDFPWGKDYPPLAKVGNYADESFHAKFRPKNIGGDNQMEDLWIVGYTDGYATTSPVVAFPANPNGLYDMGGNVWQWCEDWFDPSHRERVLRGGAWDYNGRTYLLSSYRHHAVPARRYFSYGFRCVIAAAAPH